MGLVFPLSLVASLVSFILGQSLLSAGHLDVGLGDDDAARKIVGSALYLAVAGLIGLGIGVLLRSSAGAITSLVGVFFVIPPLLNLLPSSTSDDISPYLPAAAGQALWGGVWGATRISSPPGPASASCVSGPPRCSSRQRGPARHLRRLNPGSLACSVATGRPMGRSRRARARPESHGAGVDSRTARAGTPTRDLGVVGVVMDTGMQGVRLVLPRRTRRRNGKSVHQCRLRHHRRGRSRAGPSRLHLPAHRGRPVDRRLPARTRHLHALGWHRRHPRLHLRRTSSCRGDGVRPRP